MVQHDGLVGCGVVQHDGLMGVHVVWCSMMVCGGDVWCGAAGWLDVSKCSAALRVGGVRWRVVLCGRSVSVHVQR